MKRKEREMRKNVWKRFLAMALAAVVMFTSVDCTGLVVNAEGTTKTLGKVVTEHYGISGVELAVLTHADLTANVKTYDVAAPTDLDTKVKLDVANKTITADSYTKADGVTWTPSKVVVVFTGSEEEAVADAGVYKYTGEDTVKEVKVTYEASVEVSAEEQLELLNTTYYLAMATQNMDFYLSDPDLEEYADTIQNHAVPNLDVALSLFDTIKEDEQIKELVEQREITLPADEAISELEGHIDTVDGSFKLADLYAAYEGADQVVYWAENVSTLIGSFEDTQDAIEALAASDTLVELADLLVDAGDFLDNEDAVKVGKAINDSYIPAFKNYLANDTVQEFDAEYLYASKKDVLVDEPAGDFSLPYRNLQKYQYGSDYVNATTLSIGEPTEVTVEANNRVITVEVSATVIEDNAEVDKDAANAEVVVALGDNLDAVKEAAAAKVEAAIAEMDPEGVYGLAEYEDVYNLDNYDCTVNAGDIEANGVTDNATISITYAPKIYTVECEQDATLSGEYAYGYVITLPEATAPKSYDYKVSATESYYQGTKYTVTADVTFERITNDTVKQFKSENDIAAATYADELTGNAKTILISKAVDSSVSIETREPESGTGLISFNGSDVLVANFEDGNYTWVPQEVKFLVGDNAVETITTIAGGKVTPSVTDYENVVVKYALKIDGVSASDTANTPYTLVQEAKSQLDVMDTVAGYAGDLAKIDDFVLSALKDQLVKGNAKQATIDAISVVEEECLGEDGKLVLLTLANGYSANSTYSGKLGYYYANGKAVKEQVSILATQLSIVVEDSDALTYLKGVTIAGMELAPYVEMLQEKADQLSELSARFVEKNAKIVTTDTTEYNKLLTALENALKAEDGTEGFADYEVTEVNVGSGDTLYWVKEISEPAPTKLAFTVTVQKADGEGNVSDINKKSKDIIFDKDTGLTSAEIELIKEAVTELEEALVVDKKHYTVSGVGEENIKVGLQNAASVVYTWTPNTYTVNFVDATTGASIGSADFTYDVPTIDLPKAEEGYEYTYVINGKSVKQTDNYSLKEDFEALFGKENKITIKGTKVNLAAEAEQSFFDYLNDASGGQGVSIIPYTKDGERVASAVLRITEKDGKKGIAAGMATFLQALLTPSEYSYSYIGIGGETVKDGNVTLQGLIDAILSSGVSTESLAAMFDENGNITNNFSVDGTPLKFKVDSLGGLVLETTLEYGTTSIPLYISFQSSASYKEVKDALDLVNKAVVVEGSDESVVVTVKKPVSEEAYEAYLVAMILEGRTNFAEINDVTLKEIVDYERDRFVTDLEDDNVTVTTLSNTIAKLGKDVDLSEYDEAFESIKKFVYNGGSTESGSFTYKATDDEEADNEYRMLGTAEKEALFELIDMGDMADVVSDTEYKVPVKVVVEGLEEDHDALIINDPNALKGITGANEESIKIAANAWNLVNAEEGKIEAPANSMVILLDDVTEVTFAGNAILDLNGNDVANTLTNADGTVVLVDSTYDNDGTATVDDTVKDARLNGFYKFNETDSDDDGVVDTVEVVLDAGFLAEAAEIDTAGVKLLAVEMAFDLIMNNITSGDMTIEGANGTYNIYDVEFDNILDLIAPEDGEKDTVNQLIDIVKLGNTGLIGFVNEIIDTLTNFKELNEKGIAKDTVIATYTATTNPLNVEVKRETDGDYLTAKLTTADVDKKTTVKFVVGGEEQEITDLKALVEKLAEIVTTCDIDVALEDINYVNGNIAAVGAGVDANIVVDLTGDKNYAVALGAILANGMEAGEEKDALVAAVKAYLTAGNQDSMLALKKAMESATTAQVIKAIKAAYANYDAGKDFDAVLASLGITEKTDDVKTLEGVYEDLLNVIYRVAALVSNKLGIDGDNRTLGGVAYKLSVGEDTVYAYGGSVDGTVKSVDVDATLELRLFKDIKDTGTNSDPQQPDKPGKPDDDKESDSKKPVEVHPAPAAPSASTGTVTGDANNMTLWIAVMGIAIIAVVTVVAMKKKRTK